MNAQDVLDFWFEEINPNQWFETDSELDQEITQRFSELHKAATKGELFHWRETAFGRLAEIIVLDQFSRNIFRHQPECFAHDDMALILAQEMVELGMDTEIPLNMLPFVYMPYMHSESRLIHDEAMKLFARDGMEENFIYEKEHKKIIDEFGRYPHRNAILNRLSTIKELEFLKNHPGF